MYLFENDQTLGLAKGSTDKSSTRSKAENVRYTNRDRHGVQQSLLTVSKSSFEGITFFQRGQKHKELLRYVIYH